MNTLKKRETAYKLRIGDILRGSTIFEESEAVNKRLKFVELGDKKILRVNIIANVIDKYESSGETRFSSLTIDDGSGQIRTRLFGDEMKKTENISQGDTILVIGLLRSYNQELYIMPEIVKTKDLKYLLIRKLEIEKSYPKKLDKERREEIKILRDEIIDMIKKAEQNQGIDKEDIIMKIKSEPKIISQEIIRLLEEGIIYEPKPGIVRYLG